MNQVIQEAKEFLHTVTAEYMDIVICYYEQFIKEQSDESIILELIKNLVNWDFQSDNSQKILPKYSETECEEFVEKSMKTIDKAIDRLIEKKVEENDFYLKMWNHINDGLVYGEDEGKLSAFLAFCVNPKVPYFKLEQMPIISDEEFKQISIETIPSIKKFIFISHIDFEKRTEPAYQILELLKDYPDEKQKMVLLANILLFYEIQIKRLKDSLEEDKTEK